jgi:protein-disulfide isomerase
VGRAGNKTISWDELETRLRGQLIQNQRERYELLRDGLEVMIAESLMEQEAAARGVTVEELQKTEIKDKASQPTEEEIKILYDGNKEELGGASLEDSRERLTQYLLNVRYREAYQAFIDQLKAKYPTSISLQAPTVEVSTGSRAPLGGENASVTIIEFSDYECPFCKQAEPSIEKVMETYGDKVRLFYRDYPLPFHANARPAAEAARCAGAQEKFWPYHQKLMASTELGVEKYKALADEVGLDRAKFDACLEKNDFAEAIQEDMKAGEDAGVNGTPAFFINGRLLDGARPFEQFKEIIDEELAKNKKAG